MEEQIIQYQKSYNLALKSLQDHEDVLAVFVFGSMVNGDLWDKSDIDFFVNLKKWVPGMTNVHSNDCNFFTHSIVLWFVYLLLLLRIIRKNT